MPAGMLHSVSSFAMRTAIDANSRTKIYFALPPRDARDQARHVAPYLDEGDLTRLGAYEIVLRPLADGRLLPPATATAPLMRTETG